MDMGMGITADETGVLIALNPGDARGYPFPKLRTVNLKLWGGNEETMIAIVDLVEKRRGMDRASSIARLDTLDINFRVPLGRDVLLDLERKGVDTDGFQCSTGFWLQGSSVFGILGCRVVEFWGVWMFWAPGLQGCWQFGLQGASWQAVSMGGGLSGMHCMHRLTRGKPSRVSFGDVLGEIHCTHRLTRGKVYLSEYIADSQAAGCPSACASTTQFQRAPTRAH
ncbi:hypothetical protein FA13DRAFT_1720614 [Coprinellus micaceus]|uniref:Uncharacterized protein n=1 Tax=Coprinellus micaceus TaxID=71717 RepID=A0A4Y7S7Q6_COPMI|nr:hypothetical protein FA13DRAFT_1720614 [Coprinellus micaceus]